MTHIRNFVLTMIVLVAACAAGSGSTSGFRIIQLSAGGRIRIEAAKAGNYRMEIDDAPGFRTPLWTRSFHGKSLEFDADGPGMVPGSLYYIRLNGSAAQTLRLSQPEAADLRAECGTLRASWETVGRAMLEDRSAVQWNSESMHWEASAGKKPEGQWLYYTELYLRSAVEAAEACDDRKLYDEVADYYLVMLQQTVPFAVTQGWYGRPADFKLDMNWAAKQEDAAARTFPAGSQTGDLELGDVQWLYAAAKLLRLVSVRAPGERSAVLRRFAEQYTNFIVEEQVLRYLTRPLRPAPGGGADVSRLRVWELTLRGLKGKRAWDTAMSDVDLWLLASSAEMLGAHANDPTLVPLSDQQVAQLRAALDVGVRLFRSKRTLYPETTNLGGQRVGSASYFNGDFDGYPDFDYSAVGGGDVPTKDRQQAAPGLSWDISHAYRIPVFLRALYDNRKATGVDFPRREELRLVTNQYVYRVFNGDFSRPLFRNFLDGHDTWFRVGLNGPDFGYPPSQFCDMRSANRWCMAPCDIVGWGLLAFVNPDVAKLERTLVQLAFAEDADAREFRNRHYSYRNSFEVVHPDGRTAYGDSLFFVIADNAWLLKTR